MRGVCMKDSKLREKQGLQDSTGREWGQKIMSING